MIKYSSSFPLDIFDSARTFFQMNGNIRLTFVQYWDTCTKCGESVAFYIRRKIVHTIVLDIKDKFHILTANVTGTI